MAGQGGDDGPCNVTIRADTAPSGSSRCSATGAVIRKHAPRISLEVKEGPRSRTTRAYFTPEAFFEHCISLESTSGNQVDVVMTLQGGKSVRREMTDVIGQLREAAGHLQEWRPERLAGFGKLGDDLKRRITVGFAASTVDSGEALPSAAETPRTVADLGGAVTPPSEALGGRVSPRSVQTSSGGPPTGAEDWDSGAGSATAAERAREETIRRNRERMAMLGLFETSRALADTALAKKRAAAAARPSQRGAKRPRPAEPPRRSGRLAQLPAESGGLPDVGGTLVRVGFETVRVAGEAPPSEPLDTPVPLKSDLGDAGDAAFLEALRREGASGDADRLRAKRAAGIRGYGLEERLVCKVARTAIPHLSLLPRSDMVAVAAGDKGGRVSVWVASWESWAPRDEDAETEERIAAGKAYVEEADGVAVFPAHRSYVSGLRFVGSGTGAELLTAAYDGAVRRMDVERGEMALVWGDEERELSAMDAAESGAVFVAEKDGEMGMLDTRTGGVAVQFFQGHERKINSLSVEPRGHLLASASTDSTVKVWDVRSLGPKAKPLAKIDLARSSQSAVFCPDGSGRLLVTCYDDTLRVFGPVKGKKVTEEIRVTHDNNTGRWVLPFRATWSPDGKDILCGSMNRGIDVVRADDGKLSRLDSDLQTAICSRMCCHTDLPVLAAASNSGRVHLYCPL